MPLLRNPQIVYIFLTGGYDSVFRLCQLAMSHTPVQGIYLNLANVDGIENHRTNATYEMTAIETAVIELRKMGYGQYVYPVHLITSVKLSPKVRKICYRFYKSGKWARPVTQYVYMIEVSMQLNKIIETGVLCDKSAVIHKTIGKYIDPKTQMINTEKIIADGKSTLLIFRNLRFPLCGNTKHQMLMYAKKNGFAHILKKTISCWYPGRNGKPCGNCNMCKERII
jgi:7-cyano-7-deazaguanine synthase in queuosine biosynthesis